MNKEINHLPWGGISPCSGLAGAGIIAAEINLVIKSILLCKIGNFSCNGCQKHKKKPGVKNHSF